jgi:hypothetical protein
LLAHLDYPLRCLPRRLREHLEDHDRLGIDEIDDPPAAIHIPYAKFVARRSDGWKRPGVRRRQFLASLCSRRSSMPASIRAAVENGGVLTLPFSQKTGLNAR